MAACHGTSANVLFIETLARDGEVLVRKIKNPAGNRFGFSLQFIEADYLDDQYNNTASNGNEVRMGVEITKEGKPVAYWLFEDNPNHSQRLWSSERIATASACQPMKSSTPLFKSVPVRPVACR